ncbi:MAG: metallophosphoesterase family protein [Actinomycetota bacterium]|nr:metallophosphoesterase family protein [Actinomycetota bacterium]
MRIGIIADVHSNLAALEVVLGALEGVDEIWCLGDVVGYGPDPNECIELVSKIARHCVVGNHDLGSIGEIDLADFNYEAQAACSWTGRQLKAENKDYLRGLPLKLEVAEGIMLVHGSPRDPIWEYIVSTWLAEENFAQFVETVAFVGHSHVPVVFEKSAEGPCRPHFFEEGKAFNLSEGSRYIINPGSVGQPRDRDPRASLLIFNREELSLEYHRLGYSVEKTQRKMERAGLPQFLAERLSWGI